VPVLAGAALELQGSRQLDQDGKPGIPDDLQQPRGPHGKLGQGIDLLLRQVTQLIVRVLHRLQELNHAHQVSHCSERISNSEEGTKVFMFRTLLAVGDQRRCWGCGKLFKGLLENELADRTIAKRI
jgi:hypothetical protein